MFLKKLKTGLPCVCAQSLSCVQLFVTPGTVARQAPPSMGFSRQGHWSVYPSLLGASSRPCRWVLSPLLLPGKPVNPILLTSLPCPLFPLIAINLFPMSVSLFLCCKYSLISYFENKGNGSHKYLFKHLMCARSYV